MAETRGDHAVKGSFDVVGNARFRKGLDSPYLEVIDQKLYGVAGGTFTGNTGDQSDWRTRDLTNVVHNDFATAVESGAVAGTSNLLIPSTGDSLPNPAPEPGYGGQITLERGVYYCEISAPAQNVDAHVTRLADVTDDPGATGATVVLGTQEYAADTEFWAVSESTSQTRSTITGKFQLLSQRTLEIQHLCADTQLNDGFGSDGGFYEVNNVFTTVKMWLIRDDT